MERVWTEQQQSAIDSRGESLLVSAGAGSGKTAVMTERIVSLILGGADIQKMLIVTFTKASAAEMRRRIQARLAKMAGDPKESQKHRHIARGQLERFASASISTLHSFCTQLLRRHFQEAELDPAFRVGNEYETAILKRAAAEELLEARFAQEEENFLRFDELFGNKSNGLEKLIIGSYDFLMSLPEPENWLDEACQNYAMTAEELKKSPMFREIKREGQQKLKQMAEELAQARDLLPHDEAYDKMRALLDEELAKLRGAALNMESESFEGFSDSKEVFGTLRFPSKKQIETDEALKESIKELRDAVKKEYKKLLGQIWSPEENARRLNETQPLLESFAALLRDFGTLYAERKREKDIVDFADLEHMAAKILSKEQIAKEYKERFDYVFIDEYQDSNPLQEKIVSAICREDNLFCVGDAKQSIYRFRAAEPSLFLARAKAYQGGEGGKLIFLNRNFRSQGNVIDAVNDIFFEVMSLGREQEYAEEEMLVRGLPEEEETVSVDLQILEERRENEFIEGEEENEEIRGIDAEAEIIARKILERMEGEIYDPELKTTRKCQYGDFAILLRSVRNQAERLARKLSQYGIPCHAELRGGYFEAIEVEILLNLMRLVDNREQDICWLSIMRAGFFGFCDEDILRLRAEFPKETIYEAIKAYSEKDDLCAMRCKEALNFLMDAKQRAQALRLSALLDWLIQKSGYRGMTALLRGGEQRRANIDALLQLSRQYEEMSSRGLSGFLGFVDGLRQAGQDMGEARLSGEGASCVKILSVHKSKGLEYPIVILAQTGKKINRQDQQKKILLHRHYGIGMDYFDQRRRCLGKNMLKGYIIDQMDRESLAEELRILYVALTRAQRELIIIGRQKSIAKALPKWQERRTLGSFLDFLMGALMQYEAGQKFATKAGYLAKAAKSSRAKWHIDACDSPLSEAQRKQKEGAALSEIFQKAKLEGDAAKLLEHFSFQYPVFELPSKLAVSSLSKSRITLDQSPRFLAQKRRTGTDRGLAAHAFLQYVDWRADLTSGGLKAQLEDMIKREQMTEEEADALDLSKLKRFFDSPLADRIKASDMLHRERPFSLRLPASQLYELQSDAFINVQGIIDACFAEKDGWILLDYKTDYVADKSEAGILKAAQKHAEQLQLYAMALENLSGKPVLERYIVLLSLGEAVPLQPVKLQKLLWQKANLYSFAGEEENIWDQREKELESEAIEV